ncbi:MAG: fumarylacetoacetate hydrolase family protein [Sphingomonadales bacterium]|nr:fumarylacetoacetate hydrolase family protein [Sphingomonadales bacterium]
MSLSTAGLADELFVALDSVAPSVPLFSARWPDMSIDQAYAVSLGVLERRVARGERLTGKKIGLTAEAIQQALGISEPDFGFLTDAMEVADGATVEIARHLRTPMIEAEIAFVLKHGLPAGGVTAEQVLAATDYVTACFEIVDTRFDTQRIRIVDTVADNASSAQYVLGRNRVDPRAIDLAAVHCTVQCNNAQVAEGTGAAVMGNSLNSVAWLANRLGAYGVTLDAGDVVLPGSMIPFLPARPGDSFRADMGALGTVAVAFA